MRNIPDSDRTVVAYVRIILRQRITSHLSISHFCGGNWIRTSTPCFKDTDAKPLHHTAVLPEGLKPSTFSLGRNCSFN